MHVKKCPGLGALILRIEVYGDIAALPSLPQGISRRISRLASGFLAQFTFQEITNTSLPVKTTPPCKKEVVTSVFNGQPAGFAGLSSIVRHVYILLPSKTFARGPLDLKPKY
jgi:hypothetical protein